MEREQYRHGGAQVNPFGEHAAWLEMVAALDWLPLAALVLTADGTVLGANQAWAALSAAPAEAARGDGWLRVVEPLDREPLRSRLHEAAAVGETGCADFRLARPRAGRWSRWWWRPGPARRLIACVTDLNKNPPRDDDRWRQGHDAPARLVGRSEFVNLAGRARRRSGDSQTPALRASGQAAGTDGELGLAEMAVHRLFGVGLTLQSAAGLAHGPAAARMQQAVGELDAIICDMRTAAFRRCHPERAGLSGR